MSTNAQTHSQLACFAFVARHQGVQLTVERLLHDYAIGETNISPAVFVRMAQDAGFHMQPARLEWSELRALFAVQPVIVQLKNGNCVAVVDLRDAAGVPTLRLYDPLVQGTDLIEVAQDTFSQHWVGEAVLLRQVAAAPPTQGVPFGLRWFIPELLRQRRLFADVILAAVLLYGLGLATPIFFQIVLDKVLVHHSFATLQVLTVGVVIALLFDALFNFLRRYLLIYATNRVDIRVATRTFGHLLGLPMTFFEQMPAGVIVRHLQQAGRIREFLTGRLFLTLLDSLSLLVFVPVLLLYSAQLTLIVLAFTGLTACVIGALVGPFRRRLSALYDAEGERQALLTESVHGMRTIKSLALEPQQRRAWDDRSARAVGMRHEVEKVSAFAQSLTGLLERVMMVAIVSFGALAVFEQDLTIGALVAFNMLAGRVSGPLSQLVTMVHEYQDVALSVRMLGEVMGRKPEREDRTHGIRPTLAGAVEFDNVCFRYAPDLPPALDRASFSAAAGSVLGIVGRSGSGKTTITRLLQGLYAAEQGIVRLDGYDIREIDLVHLRRSIGVVLQENFLFRGTVRQNIAAAHPSASLDEIVAAARLAGADEFIERLPRGFDTMLEENGQNLSGGQKQRLAIARALVTRPRLLIFDEATSALDPESEAIVRQNLRRIASGRTVIIVSHRLATLVEADAIMVLDRGKITDIGQHGELLQRCTGYLSLWNQQMRNVA
jgi:ATP-binding cassette subfamily B protein